MNSPHQREQLPDLLSGALDDAERARVESHLAQCAGCARELRALQLMQSTLADLPTPPAPAALRADVRAALEAEQSRSARWQFRVSNPFAARKTAAPDDQFARSSAARKAALPFALPTGSARKLAWGGALVLGTVGLMLWAQPSLQNGDYSISASVSETDLAARAQQHVQNGAKPGFSAGAAPSRDVARDNSADNASGANNALMQRAPADRERAASAPKAASGNGASAPQKSPRTQAAPTFQSPALDLATPILPPPLAPATGSAPRPNFQAPNSERAPAIFATPKSVPRASEKRPATSAKSAPKAHNAPAQATPQTTGALLSPSAPPSPTALQRQLATVAPAVENAPRATVPSTPPATDTASPASPMLATPAPSVARAGSADSDGANSESAADLNGIAGTQNGGFGGGGFGGRGFDGGFGDAPLNGSADTFRRDGNARTSRQNKTVPNELRSFEAPSAIQSDRATQMSPWPGGKVSAKLTRVDADKSSVELTLSVAKTIGAARLILLLPAGETQVWRGSLGTTPAKIALQNPAIGRARLQSGQTVRARLEQINGEGSLLSNFNFDVKWP